MSLLIFLLSLVSVLLATAKCGMSGELKYQDLQEFLAEYEPKIPYEEKYRDVILVLGNTGDGKSTFTQWIAGDDSKLISTEKGKFTGEFVINDNNERIGSSTIVSKTIYPELVVNENTQTAYYDISGFGDSRGFQYDIATSYFIKRIIDHVDRIKILLVVSYQSVRYGVDRKNLILLLRHFTELVNDSDRYLDGIGLVVTKVDNIHVMGPSGNIQLVSDEATKENVASFIQDVAGDIEKTLQSQTSTPQEKRFSNKSIEIINALISNSYERITLFRRPNQAGPLSHIRLLHDGKLTAQETVSNTLQFIPVREEDFSYTVSDDTKVKLYNLIDEIENSLEENFKSFANDMDQHYNKVLNDINDRIQQEINMQDLKQDILTIQYLVEDVKQNVTEIMFLASQVEIIEQYKNIPKLIEDALFKLNVNLSESILSQISLSTNFLDFLDKNLVLKFKFDTIPLMLVVQETGKRINESSKLMEENINRRMMKMDEDVKEIINNTFDALQNNITNYEIEVHDIEELQNDITHLYNRLLKVQKASDPKEKANMFNNILESYLIRHTDEIFTQIAGIEKYYLYFTKKLEVLVDYVSDSQMWYQFLSTFGNKLSTYEIQGNKASRKRCSDFLQNSFVYEGRQVKDTNIGFILQDCSFELHEVLYEKIRDINLTQSKVAMLVNVVNYTLSNMDFSQSCNGTYLTVKGHFVKITDINIDICNSITQLQIFATDTIFIDGDLDFTGQNVQVIIMAPEWVIIGSRHITLDGSQGENTWPTKAAIEEDGIPGLPGGNAGDFLGYGDIFTNDENLFISASGGKGGSGQDGGDGVDGRDGDRPYMPYSSVTYGLARSSESNVNLDYWRSENYYVRYVERECQVSGIRYIFYTCTDYYVTGSRCTDGSNGGRGGSGGEGGAPGTVQVYNNASFAVSTHNGDRGSAGSQGSGGSAGRPSYRLKALESNIFYILLSKKYYESFYEVDHYCNDGDTPCCYTNSIGQHNRPEKITFINGTAAFDEFRKYLFENLQSSLRKAVMNKTLVNLPM